MSGWSSVQSRIKNLGKKSENIMQGRQVSVVYMNDDGSIDWPLNPNSTGVLCVPRPCKSTDEWLERLRD